jgi:mRNA-degrading endonuclease RelE of RelBE toxin-antitoxin system
MYQMRLLKMAIEDLTALDRQVAHRIIKRLNWLAENIESTHIETLSGNLTGFCKFRVGRL